MTPTPVLIERGGGGGFPVEIFMIMILLGIVVVVFVLASTWFKYRNKTTDAIKIPTVAAPAPAESYLLGVTLTKTGEWDIRVKGQRYRTLEAVPDEATRKEIVTALKALVSFSRGYVQKDQSSSPAVEPASVAPPLAMPGLSQPGASRPEASRPGLGRSAFAPAEPSASVTPPAAEPTRTAPPVVPAPRPKRSSEPELRRTSAPAKWMPTIDLAREVGDIVAEMQAHRPDLSGRSIKLLNAASGGIDFRIDGAVYGSLDEIPDSDVRDLIQAAIKEWERR